MSEKVLNKIKEWLQNNVEHSKGILLPLDRDSQALLDYIEEWEIKELMNIANKIKSFEIYTDDEDKVLVGNSLETALEILENNGYIVEWENEDE